MYINKEYMIIKIIHVLHSPQEIFNERNAMRLMTTFLISCLVVTRVE